MKLVIDPEWHSNAEQIFVKIKKTGLQDKIEDHFVRVINGSWTFRITASWYRNQPSSSPIGKPVLEKRLEQQKLEKYEQWFFYAPAEFKKKLGFADSAFPFLHFPQGQGFDFLRGVCYAVALNAPIQATWDSPNEISAQKRQELANLIQDMALCYPEYPEWAASFPVAILGDSFRFWWNDAGTVLCPVNTEWALELSIAAGLHSRKPTAQEIQLIEKALP